MKKELFGTKGSFRSLEIEEITNSNICSFIFGGKVGSAEFFSCSSLKNYNNKRSYFLLLAFLSVSWAINFRRT